MFSTLIHSEIQGCSRKTDTFYFRITRKHLPSERWSCYGQIEWTSKFVLTYFGIMSFSFLRSYSVFCRWRVFGAVHDSARNRKLFPVFGYVPGELQHLSLHSSGGLMSFGPLLQIMSLTWPHRNSPRSWGRAKWPAMGERWCARQVPPPPCSRVRPMIAVTVRRVALTCQNHQMV